MLAAVAAGILAVGGASRNLDAHNTADLPKQSEVFVAINKTPPDLLNLSGLSQKDRIQILLSEYSTLRSEILKRTGFGFQLTAIGFAVITWLVKDPPQDPAWYFWAAVLGLVSVFVVGTFVNVRDLTRAAHRVKDLEHQINSRAGEHLLVWETLSGALTRDMGFIRSCFSRVKPLPRSKLPSLDASYLVGKANDPRL